MGFSEAAGERAKALLDKVDGTAACLLAQSHGLGPLMARNLQQKLGRQFFGTQSTNEMLRLSTRRNLVLTAELFRALDVLETNNVPAVAHKGPALATLLYGDPALRAYEDVDVLVPPSHALRAIRVLDEAGWKRDDTFRPAEERAYLRYGYEFTLRSSTRILVELQWAMAQRFYAVDFDLETMLYRAKTLTVSGRPIRILAPDDLLLALAVHAAKHMFERLSWLVDIAALISAMSLNWEKVARESRRYGIWRIVSVAINAAAAISGISVPAEALQGLGDPKVSAMSNLLLSNGLNAGALFPPRTTGYFAIFFRLRERLQDRLRMARRLVFKPGPSEWSMVRLPELLFPLYVPIRVFRLICRAARAILRFGNQREAEDGG
ncbi:MAG: nucleotidyltransferase family protein [Terriglobales bacterium]